MPKYWVDLPIVGQVSVEVEAESKQAAIDAALGMNHKDNEMLQWEVVEHVTTGNVFYGPLNSACATEQEEGE